MKKNYMRYNSASALFLKIIEIVSGLILPRYILLYFGSAQNGLVSSITQFLGVISFLDMGIATVVTSALYKPIVKKDQKQIDQVVSAASGFFKKIAIVLVVYVVVLCFIFPLISESPLDYFSTAMLIVAMAIGTFAQYYTGLVDQIFLTANQKEYIYSLLCAVTIVLNTVCSVCLICLGASIHVVKLATSLIYLIRPIFTRIYIRKRYTLNRRAEYEKDTIPQRWNGVAQHVASKVLKGTDTIVLTIFSIMENVSIYAVYYFVVNGVYTLVYALINGINARLGLLWAEGKHKKVEIEYRRYEWMFHLAITFVYGCCLVLIVPFVMTYTNGVTDVDYYQPVFAFVITIAFAVMLMAQYGVVIIKAVNHYKQTQTYYIISALINVVISVLLVIQFGLVGVAVGTLAAMLYQYAWTQWYMARKIFHSSILGAVKQISTDFSIIAIGCIILRNLSIGDYNYFAWIIMAIKVALVYLGLVILGNTIIYPKKMQELLHGLIRKKL